MALTHGIGVHTQHRCIGKQLVQFLLYLLGARTDMLQFSSTFRAILCRFFTVAAVVAHQTAVGRVVCQIHAAPGALGHITARRAE